MKIEVDVTGVEQSMDFTTMTQGSFVLLSIFGVAMRVPVSEQQMEEITLAALRHQQTTGGDPVFPETRAISHTQPEYTEQEEEPQERDFSVMTELTDVGRTEMPDDGVSELFQPSSDEAERIAELRARPRPVAGSKVSGRDHTPDHSQNLPKIPGFGGAADDEGIQQG